MQRRARTAVLVKFAAGTDNGLHTHTYDIKAVVISGTFLYGSGGAAPKNLGPGSYLLIPGGMKAYERLRCRSRLPLLRGTAGEVRHQASEGRRRGGDEVAG
jgi:hypothetical protein